MIRKLNRLKNPKKSKTVFFILDGEWPLTAAPHCIAALQRYVLDSYRSSSFLVFFERNILSEEYKNLFVKCPSFLQNVFYHRLYAKEHIKHFVHHLAALYGFSIKKEEVGEIWNRTGGYIWLTTEAVRHLHRTGQLTFDHDEMVFRLQSVWSGFTPEEQRALSQVVQFGRMQDISADTKHYLKKMLLLEESRVGVKITVPILRDFIAKTTQKEQNLRIVDDAQLWIGQTPISSLFSKREHSVVLTFLKAKGDIVSRDIVACLLWGDRWEDQYSDWAIDQAMRRLRRKLSTLGIAQNVLHAKKGKGFIYSQTL